MEKTPGFRPSPVHYFFRAKSGGDRFPGGRESGRIKIYGDLLGIPAEETAAFGDADNDIDMLEASGFGFAVENASPACLAAADYITRSNREDGVAFGIYAILGIPASEKEEV